MYAWSAFFIPLGKKFFLCWNNDSLTESCKIHTLISIYPGNSLSFVLCSQGREGARKYNTREALVEGRVWLDPAIPGPIPDGSLVLTPPLAQCVPGRRAWGCPDCLGVLDSQSSPTYSHPGLPKHIGTWSTPFSDTHGLLSQNLLYLL